MLFAPRALTVLLLTASACAISPKNDGAAGEPCTRCHGRDNDPAPPVALNGDTETTSMGVGAHQAHVRGSSMRPALACSECHPMPSPDGASEHPMRTGHATVVFDNLAHRDSASAQWDRETATCSDVFCHGSTLRGGEDRPPPVWTRVGDGTHTKCTSCHGFPPGGHHSQDERCETCHSLVMAPGGVIQAPELHVNGKLELDHLLP